MGGNFDIHFFEATLKLDLRLLRPLIRMHGAEPRKVLRWWDLVAEMKSLVLELAAPRGVFKFFSLKSIDDQFVIEGNVPLRLLSAQKLRGAEIMGLFGITLGDKLERRATKLFSEGNYPKGYLVDLLGTYALTELQTQLLDRAKDRNEVAQFVAGPGLQPGSAHWPIESQRLFFELLPLEQIGIGLLDSLSLCPAKSKTFGYGFWRKG